MGAVPVVGCVPGTGEFDAGIMGGKGVPTGETGPFVIDNALAGLGRVLSQGGVKCAAQNDSTNVMDICMCFFLCRIYTFTHSLVLWVEGGVGSCALRNTCRCRRGSFFRKLARSHDDGDQRGFRAIYVLI